MPIYLICVIAWIFFNVYSYMVFSLFLIIPTAFCILFLGPFFYIYTYFLKKYKQKLHLIFKVLTHEFYYIFVLTLFYRIIKLIFNKFLRKLGL